MPRPLVTELGGTGRNDGQISYDPSSPYDSTSTGWVLQRIAAVLVDGSDQGAAINAAIQAIAASGGGAVRLVPKTTGICITEERIVLADNICLDLNQCTLKAKDGSDFEHVVYAVGKSNVSIVSGIVDANQAGRLSALTTRACCVYFETCTEPRITNVIAKNAVGSASIPGIGICFAGVTVKGRIHGCIAKDGGVVGKAADGFYMSGTQNLITGCISYNNLDTSFAVENSNYSGVVGCTSMGTSCGAAITNAQNVSVTGNFIDGLTIFDWNATVTGGMQFGNPANTTTGNLLNTRVSNITIERLSGSGAAINLRKTGAADTVGITFENIRIKGASAQCFLLLGTDVFISGCNIEGTSSSPAIQIQSGSSKVKIKSTNIYGQFNFGIYSDGSNDVEVAGCSIAGDSVTSTHGIYFANTATKCRALWNNIEGVTTARVGSDAGTTPTVIHMDTADGSHKLLMTKTDTQVITTRQTGYTNAMAGTANRATSYNTATITLVQLAERVKAIQDDLTTHGLIGP